MGRFIKQHAALLAMVVVLIACNACTHQASEPKELPQILGTDAERGTP